MKVVVLAGTGSGVGKTRLAERLIGVLPGWAAVKLSPAEPGHDHGLAGDYEIRAASTETGSPGTDTGRLAAAGARPVLWVVARRDAIERALDDALARLSDAPGVLVEGGAAWARPGALRILVRGDDAKPGSAPLAATADHVLGPGEPEDAVVAAVSAWSRR